MKNNKYLTLINIESKYVFSLLNVIVFFSYLLFLSPFSIFNMLVTVEFDKKAITGEFLTHHICGAPLTKFCFIFAIMFILTVGKDIKSNQFHRRLTNGFKIVDLYKGKIISLFVFCFFCILLFIIFYISTFIFFNQKLLLPSVNNLVAIFFQPLMLNFLILTLYVLIRKTGITIVAFIVLNIIEAFLFNILKEFFDISAIIYLPFYSIVNIKENFSTITMFWVIGYLFVFLFLTSYKFRKNDYFI